MEDFRSLVIDIIYSREMFSAAYGMTQNFHNAKDLIQETALKLLSNEHHFNGGNLHGWSYTVLKNNFINKTRSHYYKKTILFDNPETVFDEWVESDAAKKEVSESHLASIETLIEGIQKLNTNDKEAIILSLGGYKLREIAEIVDSPIGTIKSRVFKGKKELKWNKQLVNAYKNSKI